MLRRVAVVFACPLVLVLGVVFGCAPALAGTGFSFSSSFASPGGFAGPVGLAVNDSVGLAKGDVYVSDQGHNALDEFDAAGTFLREVGVAGAAPDQLAVDDYAGPFEGDVYVAGFGSGVVYRFGSGLVLEKESKGFVEPTGVAVDEAGDLFVAEDAGNAENARVLEFNAAGEPIDAAGAFAVDDAVVEGLQSPQAIAVSANGEQLYIATAAGTLQYSIAGATYSETATLDTRNSTVGVSISPSGNVFVDRGPEVVEYEPSGAFVAQFGAETLSGAAGGIGVGEAGMYVADTAANTVDLFEAGETPASPTTGPTGTVTGSTAMLEGTLNAGGGATSGYYFAYNQGASCTGGATTTVGVSAGGAVQSEASELQSTTQYSYCLVATNAYGSTFGPDVSFETKVAPPSVEGGAASDVTPTSVTLTAQVNPNGADTRYYFQYGTGTGYGSSAPAAPGIDIGSGRGAQPVSATVQGLQPGTLYHYRVLAVDSAGTSEGADETFTTFAPETPFALPDGRVYEQATPVNKNGVEVSGETNLIQAASNGQAISFVSPGSIANDSGSQALPVYVAHRGTEGWTFRGVEPPASTGQYPRIRGWSEDLSEVFIQNSKVEGPRFAPGLKSPGSLLLQSTIDGSLQTISSGRTTEGPEYAFADATPDGSRVLFEAEGEALLPNAAVGQRNLFEWNRDTNTVSLAGVLPDGLAPPGGSSAGPEGGSFSRYYTQHTISNDGSRVFFTAGGTGQIYVRENGTTTVPVSEGVSSEPAFFNPATPDGAYAFFTVEGDLYRFDVASRQALELTPAGGVEGVIGVSDDGSYAYFAAAGETYVWHEGVVSLVAPATESQNWSTRGVHIAKTEEKTGFVSPDGRTLLLRLTGYEYPSFRELYRYYAPTGKLSCVSCDPTGAEPTGGVSLQKIEDFAYEEEQLTAISGFHNSLQTRNLADDGRRVFFESPDALVPQDTNGVLDVYEWEADGTGGCGSESQNGGCLYLISSGHSPDPSYFADASESGDDVFFFTSQPLVREDQDQL